MGSNGQPVLGTLRKVAGSLEKSCLLCLWPLFVWPDFFWEVKIVLQTHQLIWWRIFQYAILFDWINTILLSNEINN